MNAKVSQLGYLGFEVSELAAWESFATAALGMEVAARSPGSLAFRMDGHAKRIVVTEGKADDLSFIGWQVNDVGSLRTIEARLREAGVVTTPGGAALARERGVEELILCEDPAGNPLEIFCGPEMAAVPFESSVLDGGFVADGQGLGHLVVTSNDNEEHTRFYCELLGLGVSDFIRQDLGTLVLDLVFLHANTRHHSLAFGGKQAKRVHHVGIQVASLDDLGRTFDRVVQAKVPIAATLGRHPNDRMVSFYVESPSGIQVEIGWGGNEIDPSEWSPTTYECWREWGHLPPRVFAK